MYKVNPDGSISCTTLEEALRVQQSILNNQPAKARRSTAAAEAVNTGARQFLESLKPHHGKQVNSEQIRKLTGADTTAGVGPKLRHMRTALASEGISLDSYLQQHKERNEDGTRIWTVNYRPITEKSA
jgi:hypothetical protein